MVLRSTVEGGAGTLWAACTPDLAQCYPRLRHLVLCGRAWAPASLTCRCDAGPHVLSMPIHPSRQKDGCQASRELPNWAIHIGKSELRRGISQPGPDTYEGNSDPSISCGRGGARASSSSMISRRSSVGLSLLPRSDVTSAEGPRLAPNLAGFAAPRRQGGQSQARHEDVQQRARKAIADASTPRCYRLKAPRASYTSVGLSWVARKGLPVL